MPYVWRVISSKRRLQPIFLTLDCALEPKTWRAISAFLLLQLAMKPIGLTCGAVTTNGSRE